MVRWGEVLSVLSTEDPSGVRSDEVLSVLSIGDCAGVYGDWFLSVLSIDLCAVCLEERDYWNILGSIGTLCLYSLIVATIVPTFFWVRSGAVATISSLNGKVIPSTCLKSEVST